MALPIKNIKKLHKGLEYNFLYNDDPNAMHLLLSMLENEVKLKRLRPKYTSMNSIQRSLKRVLIYRRDREMILRALTGLINDDVNRLELSVYIDSYSSGYQDDFWVNRLENLAIKSLPIEDICGKAILFHESKSKIALQMRDELIQTLDSDLDNYERLKKITFTYCERVIKKKVYNLNEYLDNQLTIDYVNDATVIRKEEFLTIPELTNIYQKLIAIYMSSMIKIFRNAYWYGMNDRVLNRYQR